MKIKLLTKEQIIISIDRLTRFKNTENKYLRVFKELILHNLIEPRFNKNDLDKMPYCDIKNYAQEILNCSVDKISLKKTKKYEINEKLKAYEKSVFKIDKNTEHLLENQINYNGCLDLIDENSPNNLRWLKELSKKSNIISKRKTKSFTFPIEVVVLAEGATEETLLPEFAKLYNFDFDKNGIFVIPAGGKNQVVKLYYELYDTLKIPIFVLFDKDGAKNAQEIEPKLRKTDKIHIIECGEFEDTLSKNLVNRTLNYELQNISETKIDLVEQTGCRVKYLEGIFKNRGMHEFKKVEFSQMLKRNIRSKKDLTPEIIEIISSIKDLKSDD